MSKHKISVACLIEYKDKILLIKESQNGEVSWDIPAGGLELNESIKAGLKRELEEESGLIIDKAILIATFQFIEENRTTLNFLFYSKLNSLNKKPLKKVKGENILASKWFSKDEISELVKKNKTENNLAKARLKFYLENYKNSNKQNCLPLLVEDK